MTLPGLTGIILAGGRSSRFGSDKAFALLGGRTLLEIAASNLDRVCSALVVVAAPGRDPARYAVGGAQVVFDDVEGEGPLVGIVAGLRAAAATVARAAQAATPARAVVVAVDMPCVSGAVVELLAGLAPEADVVAPVIDGRPEPLHAVYATRAAEEMAAAVARGVRKITDAWEGLRVEWVDEAAIRAVDPELRTVWNVNRPEDMARIQAALGA